MIDINNPGNLRPLPGGETWLGQTGVRTTDDGAYCEFATPPDGIRALAKNLRAYKALGVKTCLDFATHWAPGEDHNSPSSYASFVAAQIGIMPSDPISLDDGPTLVKMAKAITIMENGWAPAAVRQPNGNWYPDAVFVDAINLALTT